MRTLVVLYPGSIEFEVLLAAHLVGEKYPVFVATPDGLDYESANGMCIRADSAFSEVDVSNVKIALVPGGDPASVVGDESLNTLMRSASERGAIIGAICAGPFILAQAGLLRGRRVAHGYEREQLEFLRASFEGAHLSEAEIETDATIVTAKPTAFVDFAIEIARIAGVVTDPARVRRLREYYRGKPITE